MKKRKEPELEPMPRKVQASLAVFALIFVALVLVAGKYFLANWKADAVFLPVALFIGLLLIAVVVSQMLRIPRRRK